MTVLAPTITLQSLLFILKKIGSVANQGKSASFVIPFGPNSLNFMQFSPNILQNNGLARPPWELAPPLGNPGSATENAQMYVKIWCTRKKTVIYFLINMISSSFCF